MLQLIVSSIQYSTTHKLFVIRLSVDVRVSCIMFSYKSKYFLQFLPIKNFINKKVNAHQMQENKIPFPFFVLSLKKYIHLSTYIHFLFICLFFTLCNLLFTNCKYEKRKKKIFETVYFSRLLCIKLNPKKTKRHKSLQIIFQFCLTERTSSNFFPSSSHTYI